MIAAIRFVLERRREAIAERKRLEAVAQEQKAFMDAQDALAKSLRPDPQSRQNRFAQWTAERRERYLTANEGLMRV